MKITNEQVEAAEEIASDVYDKQMKPIEGIDLLSKVHGLNFNTARDFVSNYRCMVDGRLFQRSMSAPATDYFLHKIKERRGPKSHAFATVALAKHINYYQSTVGTNLNKMRAVLEEHRNSAALLSMKDQEEQFQEEVKESLEDTPENRRKRLEGAPKTPVKIVVTTVAYQRNPDVVAEVLHRANGVCERCKMPAPFKRKKNSEPYLEVHHLIQLSQGGEDTIENAAALCPNCHRHLHFGIVD